MNRVKFMYGLILMWSCAVLFNAAPAVAQEYDPRMVAYPDFIVINGNVVSMDDGGVNNNVGSTYQALAVRNGRIQALGTTAEIRRMVGPATRIHDVKGRTVIPGIIDTHTHPHEYADEHWGQPLPGDYTIEEEPGGTWEDIVRKTLDLVVSVKDKHPEGEWLFINWPRDIASSDIRKDTMLRVHRILTRHMLDEVNTKQNIYITGNRGVLNTRGLESYGAFFGSGDADEPYPDVYPDDGITLSGSVGRVIRGEITPIPIFMSVMEQEFLEFTALGVTTFGSRIGLYNQTAAIMALDKAGRMPLRYAYALDSYWFRNMPGYPGFLTDLSGTGSDWLWENGVSISSGDGAYPLLATTIEARPEIKERELLRERINFVREYTKAGLRWSNTHIAGDRTLEIALDLLEQGSAEAGLTLEQIREKRHASDHCRMNPRPEQLPRLKRLNITMSCAPKYIEGSDDVLKDYGEEYLSWVVPMKSIIDAGVRAVFEVDTHAAVGEGYFYHIGQYVNREGSNGEVYAPEQRINRILALKTAMLWAAYYVLKEDDLGTLEEGKLADFLVLNKNYFDEQAVPDLMIKTVRPLMTVVGGQTRYLDPGLAAELQLEPTGIHPERLIRQISEWEAGNHAKRRGADD